MYTKFVHTFAKTFFLNFIYYTNFLVILNLRLAVEKVMRREDKDPMLWTTILSGPIKPELGEYCKIFEREAKAREQAELREDVMGKI